MNNYMENKVLLSTRLDPQTLKKVEAFAAKNYCWKRNTVISHVLDAVFDCFDDKAIYDMVRYYKPYHQKTKASFSLEKAD